MKTLFFIAALAGAVYLIMQTPAGKAWLEQSEPELHIQQGIQKKAREEIKEEQQVATVSLQMVQLVEKKMTELTQHVNQKQQAQINQLESRIAELENELVMGRIAKKQQQQSVSSAQVTLHPYKQPKEQFVALPSEQGFDIDAQTADVLTATSASQLQRKRQARLQDIAQKMEMSSLQALVN
jgi:protein-tyrosine-phosphatase